MNLHQKPAPSEYPAYFETYLKRLPDSDILETLEEQVEIVIKSVINLEEAETEKGYAEGKWSLKELLQHMLDTERVMTYRALCFSRGENAMLPAFDENEYAKNSEANRRPLAEIVADYRFLRQSTVALFKSFSPEMLMRQGKANNAVYNVRSIAWVIAAHENHHFHIMQTRYLMPAVSV